MGNPNNSWVGKPGGHSQVDIGRSKPGRSAIWARPAGIGELEPIRCPAGRRLSAACEGGPGTVQGGHRAQLRGQYPGTGRDRAVRWRSRAQLLQWPSRRNGFPKALRLPQETFQQRNLSGTVLRTPGTNTGS